MGINKCDWLAGVDSEDRILLHFIDGTLRKPRHIRENNHQLNSFSDFSCLIRSTQLIFPLHGPGGWTIHSVHSKFPFLLLRPMTTFLYKQLSNSSIFSSHSSSHKPRRKLSDPYGHLEKSSLLAIIDKYGVLTRNEAVCIMHC